MSSAAISWIKLHHSVIAGRLEAEVAKQKETITRLRQDIKALTSQNESAGESVKAVKDQLAKKEAELNEFLATAGDSITMRNRLVALETERQVLLADNETLRAEKLAAGDDSSKTWFALGALTLLGRLACWSVDASCQTCAR